MGHERRGIFLITVCIGNHYFTSYSTSNCTPVIITMQDGLLNNTLPLLQTSGSFNH